MSFLSRDPEKSILSDDVACARRINRRNVQIRQASEKGRGVFASQAFLAGETVIIGLVASVESQRTIYTVQIDWDRHAIFEEPAIVINHCCEPNVVVLNNRFGGCDFIALRDIGKDDEITFDYATTEYVSIAVPICRCGSANCRGAAGGFSTLSFDHPLRATRFVAAYLASTATKSVRGDQNGA